MNVAARMSGDKSFARSFLLQASRKFRSSDKRFSCSHSRRAFSQNANSFNSVCCSELNWEKMLLGLSITPNDRNVWKFENHVAHTFLLAKLKMENCTCKFAFAVSNERNWKWKWNRDREQLKLLHVQSNLLEITQQHFCQFEMLRGLQTFSKLMKARDLSFSMRSARWT